MFRARLQFSEVSSGNLAELKRSGNKFLHGYWPRFFAERHQKEKLLSEAFPFAAEHGDFCLGERPKITARREAEQRNLGHNLEPHHQSV